MVILKAFWNNQRRILYFLKILYPIPTTTTTFLKVRSDNCFTKYKASNISVNILVKINKCILYCAYWIGVDFHEVPIVTRWNFQEDLCVLLRMFRYAIEVWGGSVWNFPKKIMVDFDKLFYEYWITE